jgi:multiple sugar transport system permease protein
MSRVRHGFTVASFMAPAGIGIVVFFVYPLISAVYFSFTKFDLLTPPEWVGLRNYRHVFDDPYLHRAAWNTLWLVLVLVPARMLGGLGSALLLTSLRRAKGLFRTIFYLPALAPPVAATLAFVYLLKPGVGPVNQFLGHIGIQGPLWFNSAAWAKPSLVLLGLWGVGDVMVLYLAALLDVPSEHLEAAALDGANAWQRFRHVTLPAIAPVVLFTAVIGVITTLQYFTQAAVAASAASNQATVGEGASVNFGYPDGSTFTYPLWLYQVGFRYNAFGYANALAVLLFVVAFAVTLVLLRRSRTLEAAA